MKDKCKGCGKELGVFSSKEMVEDKWMCIPCYNELMEKHYGKNEAETKGSVNREDAQISNVDGYSGGNFLATGLVLLSILLIVGSIMLDLLVLVAPVYVALVAIWLLLLAQLVKD